MGVFLFGLSGMGLKEQASGVARIWMPFNTLFFARLRKLPEFTGHLPIVQWEVRRVT